jgi:hypothetical protein
MPRYGTSRVTGTTPAPSLALVRAWAAGVLVLALTAYAQMAVVHDNFVGARGVGSFGAALALVHLPNLVCVVLATWAAARAHPEPWREMPVRHAVAGCAVPAAAQVLTLSLRWDRAGLATPAFWMSTAVALAGCAAGMLLDAWWEGRD